MRRAIALILLAFAVSGCILIPPCYWVDPRAGDCGALFR